MRRCRRRRRAPDHSHCAAAGPVLAFLLTYLLFSIRENGRQQGQQHRVDS